VKETGKEEVRLLISDFGTCKRMWETPTKRTGNTGTMEYIAPELMRTDEFGHYSECADEKCDMWSLGVILYMMAFNMFPFPAANVSNGSLNKTALINQIVNFSEVSFPRSHNRSPELLALINVLLQNNPENRPSTDTILYSSFVSHLLYARKKFGLVSNVYLSRKNEMKMKRIPTSNQLDVAAIGTSLSSTAASSISTEMFDGIFSGTSNVTQRKGKGTVMNKGPLVSSSCPETMEVFTCTEQKNREKSKFFSFQNRVRLSFWNLFLKRKGNARQFIQASLLLAKVSDTAPFNEFFS